MNEKDIRLYFEKNGKKYMVLIPAYDLTWRLFDFPYTNDPDKSRRCMTQKEHILKFIEGKISLTIEGN